MQGPNKNSYSNKHTHIFQEFIDKKTAEVSGNIKGAHAASELRRKKELGAQAKKTQIVAQSLLNVKEKNLKKSGHLSLCAL